MKETPPTHTCTCTQFMLIFHYAREGTLRVEGLKTIAATCDVTEEGVSGAKSFFEAKAQQVAAGAKFEQEIKQEQERKKKEAAEAAERRAAFKEKAAMFQ